VAIPAGTYRLGPDDGTISLRTGRTGAAAKAGHDLLIHATSWEATITVGGPGEGAVALDIDGGSMVVIEGTGGMKALTEDDRADISKTIDDEILKRQPVVFRSTRVEPEGEGVLRVEGDLTLLGATRPIGLDVHVTEDGAISGGLAITQSDFGIKPYSTLFGALKVSDRVELAIDARLPAA
jgi:hypothetical protein